MSAKERLRILVIDDDPEDVRSLARHLREIDDREIELHCEPSFEGSLERIATGQIELVFLDDHLGARTALELLARIKREGFSGPIVMLSARGDEQLAAEALQRGATDYLAKGAITTEVLRRALTNALHKVRLERELETHRESLERTNADLQKRSHEIETFYHTLSHELKTPLTSVREFTSILLDGLAGQLMPEQRDHLQVILDGCEQMRLFLDDILDASRLETGKLSVVMSDCDLSSLVQRTVASLSIQCRQAGVALHAQDLADLPHVWADELRLAQVLNNLIGNALKYTPPGGQVTIEASAEGPGPDLVRVRVQDTGCGIEADHQARVFDRLFQVRESDTSTHGGLGLGLNICKGIIDLHGGEIHVESEPSHGSQFIFTIPCVHASSRPSPHPVGDAS